MSDLDHQENIWGYYCVEWCEACKANQIICNICETAYGNCQWHDCEKALKKLKAKQLEFPFAKVGSKK